MKIGIHQSSFLPYVGYWNKLINSDVFFDLGDFDFSPNEMYHRTFVYDSNKFPELKYLTIPVKKEKVIISNIQITDIKKHNDSLKNVLLWYKKNVKCFHWKNVYDLIMSNNETDNLYKYNSYFIDSICKYLNVDTKIIRESGIKENLHKSERLIGIIKNHTADECIYLSGSGGRNYIENDLFEKNKISVQLPTSNGEFFKGTIIDYLMRYSPEECKKIIAKQFNWS